MQFLNSLGQIIWVVTLMVFMLFMITSICAAGVFVSVKLIEFMKDEL
jgi:hypothetical protein